jgi:hypothetical protein
VGQKVLIEERSIRTMAYGPFVTRVVEASVYSFPRYLCALKIFFIFCAKALCANDKSSKKNTKDDTHQELTRRRSKLQIMQVFCCTNITQILHDEVDDSS